MRVGIDLGGTKIAGIVLADDGVVLAERRMATPQCQYRATVEAIAALVAALESEVQQSMLPLGVGTPGTLDPATHQLRGCNSTILNGQPLQQDLQTALRRPVALANDANCLALSEALDGAGQGARTVFAVILGTGVGGGIVVEGRLLDGPHGIAGEWGHTPLPGPREGVDCWCGRGGCVEAHLCGPALARRAGYATGEAFHQALLGNDTGAEGNYQAWLNDLGRALSVVINILDPEVVVLGGGLSHLPELCSRLTENVAGGVFAPQLHTRFALARHGAASGVRGAARLAIEVPPAAH